MIYFDNAATSYPKPTCVRRAVARAIKKAGGNAGRSSHKLSLRAAETVYSCREKLADFFVADKAENVIFTLNATYALNIAIKGLVAPKSHILISDIEHNSVLRPVIARCKSHDCIYDIFSTSGNVIDNIKKKHRRPDVIICSHVSNVTGFELPIIDIGKYCKSEGITFIVDASQSAGHIAISMRDCPADALCAPGHKGMYGIGGVGIVLFSGGMAVDTIIEGGSGSDSFSAYMPTQLPERLEAGTLPTPAIASLSAGVDFINKIGIQNIHEKESKLTDRALDMLSSVKDCAIYSVRGNGIVSFNIRDIPSEIVAESLARRGICVRAGFHCAPLAHKKLGTDDRGCVRMSFSYKNNIHELERFYKALREV